MRTLLLVAVAVFVLAAVPRITMLWNGAPSPQQAFAPAHAAPPHVILPLNTTKIPVQWSGGADIYAPHLYDWYFAGGYVQVPAGYLPTAAITVQIRLFASSYSTTTYRKFINTGPTTTSGITGGQDTLTSDSWSLRITFNNSAVYVTTGGTPLVNAWKRLLVGWNGASTGLWGIDSSYSTVSLTGAQPSQASKLPLYIGANYAGAEAFYGWVSYVLIHGMLLSTSEAESVRVNYTVPASGLSIFLDATFFNGTRYIDLSGRGAHGVPYGAVLRVPAQQVWVWRLPNAASDGAVHFKFFPPGTLVWFGDGTYAEIAGPINGAGLVEDYAVPVATASAKGGILAIEMPSALPGMRLAPHLYDWYFNGNNGYVSIAMPKTDSEITVAEWIYMMKSTSSYSSFGAFTSSWSPNSASYLIWHDPHIGIYIRWRVQGVSSTSPILQYTTNIMNRWVFVIGWYSKSQNAIKLFVDAKLVDKNTFSDNVAYPNIPWYIGRYISYYFGGYIGAVVVFNYALDDVAIYSLYKTKILVHPQSLFLDPTFFNGTRYIDLSGNGNHGTPYGGVQRVPAQQVWVWRIVDSGSSVVLRFWPVGTYVVFRNGSVVQITALGGVVLPSGMVDNATLSALDAGRVAYFVAFYTPVSGFASAYFAANPPQVLSKVCMWSGSASLSKWTLEALVYVLPGGRLALGSWGVAVVDTAGVVWAKSASGQLYGLGFAPAYGWAHVVASYDGSSVKVWVNGALASSRAVTAVTSFTSLTVASSSGVAVAWIKLWSGAVSSQSDLSALVSGSAPPGFALVAGADFRQYPPAFTGAGWSCAMFGAPVQRVLGAYVDSSWTSPYPAYGVNATFAGFEFSYSLVPAPLNSSWRVWPAPPVYLSESGIAGAYQPAGYAGVVYYDGKTLFYNGTSAASISLPQCRGWCGLAYGQPGGGKAVLHYVELFNTTSSTRLAVDFRWWPPLSTRQVAAWAAPALAAPSSPANASWIAIVTNGVVQASEAWIGGGALLPSVTAVTPTGATVAQLHWGVRYAWRGPISAPPATAVVPSTSSLAGWLVLNATASVSNNAISVDRAAILYAAASAPGTYTVSISAPSAVSAVLTAGNCTAAGSGTSFALACNVPPGFTVLQIWVSGQSSISLSYSPPGGSAKAYGPYRLGSPPLFHHPLSFAGLENGLLHYGRYWSRYVSQTVCFTGGVDVFGPWGYAGAFNCTEPLGGASAPGAPRKYVAHLPTRTVNTTSAWWLYNHGPGSIVTAAPGVGAVSVKLQSGATSAWWLYNHGPGSIVTAAPGVGAVSVKLQSGEQYHLVGTRLYYGVISAVSVSQNDTSVLGFVGVPLGVVTSQWWSDGSNIFVRAAGYVSDPVEKILPYLGNPASVALSCTGPRGEYMLVVKQQDVDVYALQITFAESSASTGVIKVPTSGWYTLALYEGTNKIWSDNVYIDPFAQLSCNVFIPVKQISPVAQIPLGRSVVPVLPVPPVSPQMSPALLPLVLALFLAGAYYMMRELSSALLIAAPMAIATGAAVGYTPFIAAGVVLLTIGVWMKLRRTSS